MGSGNISRTLNFIKQEVKEDVIMFDRFPDIMNIDQLAAALCIGKSSAYMLIRSKEIGCKRVGRKIIIPKRCLIDYIQSARITETEFGTSLSSEGGQK